jgi:predicted nucleic acid-binding protein
MIFVDSNIPMYLVGAAHPNKDAALRTLEGCITRGERLVADAQVLQEILHRYVAINRRDALQPAIDALLGVVDHVYPIEMSDIERAKTLLLGVRPISARDAIHVAVMQRHKISRILTFDAGFDAVSGVERVHS